ncbi:Scr1 family TA system antitoxin-like transcriptional regulator [Actinosynnema sp. NPDC059335]|uniref:Scr1 family TA system antitoxin-like transcriptional regulator n=1 Tax=Actinosynnema sp. NPDC059335 TaxID=3346804 RepID=UPI003670C4AA
MTAGEDIRPPLRLVPGSGWWNRPSTVDRSRHGPDLIDLIRLVGRRPGEVACGPNGSDLVVFEPLCVPEPLRTPAYALALGHRAIGDDALAHDVPAHDPGDRPVPATARFFVHEAALHVRVGDDAVMAGQFDALADRDDVPVRLVPFAAGHVDVLRSPFTLPDGRRQAEVLDRVALDVPSSRSAFRRRAAHHRNR